MLRKLVAILLCVCLLFEQAVAAAQTVDLSSHITGIMNAELRDKYRPVHLRSLSPLSFSPDDTVRLTFDRGDAAPLTPEHMRENADGSFRHFQVGLALPDEAFWVNLRPDEPERIIDSSLALTDTGRILLEADLLLKKETARLMSPDTPEGREYWQKIITASEKIFGYKGVPLATSTRVWIVPGEIIVRQAPESVYIYKATLNVLLEQDYFRDEYRHESYSPESELNTYAAGVIRDTVIPRLKQEVNVSRHFAPLRQVFYSLILSQWVKRRNRGQTMLYGVNSDSGDLSGLVAAEPWSALECYQEYRRSAMNGEYSFTIGRQSSGGRQVMSAMTGGVDLGFIIPHTLPDIVHPGTHISSPLKDGGRMHILGAQAPVGNNRGYLVSADYRKGKLTVGQFDEDVSLSPLLPAADFSEEDGASTGKKKRRWLRPVKYVLSTLLLTAGSFFLPALALAHKFIMSGSRLIGVPEAWSYASASENTLWGIARNILDAHPELESSAQNIHVLVQEIQRVNPEIVSPHQIYPGQEVDVPEEYATPEVIEALTGVSPAAEQVADTQGDFKESVDSADVLDTPLRPSPGADTPAPEAAEEQAIPLLEQITGGIDVLLTAQPAYFIIAAGVVAAVGIGGLIFFLVRLRQHKKAENETADAREAQPQPNQAWQRISKERRKINGETKQAFEYKLIEQWEQKLEHPEALHAQMPQIRNICRTALAAYPVPKKEGRDFFDKLHRLAYLTIKQLDKELSVTDATLRRAEIGHDLVWLKRAYRVFTHHALAGKSLEQMSVHGGFMIPTVPEVKKNMGRVSYWPRGWLDGVFQKAIWLYRGLRWLAALNRFSGGIATGMWIEKRRIRRHFKASMDLVNGNEQEEGLIPNFYRDRQGTLVHLEEVMQSYANEKWKDGAAYIDRVRKHIMRLVPLTALLIAIVTQTSWLALFTSGYAITIAISWMWYIGIPEFSYANLAGRLGKPINEVEQKAGGFIQSVPEENWNTYRERIIRGVLEREKKGKDSGFDMILVPVSADDDRLWMEKVLDKWEGLVGERPEVSYVDKQPEAADLWAAVKSLRENQGNPGDQRVLVVDPDAEERDELLENLPVKLSNAYAQAHTWKEEEQGGMYLMGSGGPEIYLPQTKEGLFLLSFPASISSIRRDRMDHVIDLGISMSEPKDLFCLDPEKNDIHETLVKKTSYFYRQMSTDHYDPPVYRWPGDMVIHFSEPGKLEEFYQLFVELRPPELEQFMVLLTRKYRGKLPHSAAMHLNDRYAGSHPGGDINALQQLADKLIDRGVQPSELPLGVHYSIDFESYLHARESASSAVKSDPALSEPQLRLRGGASHNQERARSLSGVDFTRMPITQQHVSHNLPPEREQAVRMTDVDSEVIARRIESTLEAGFTPPIALLRDYVGIVCQKSATQVQRQQAAAYTADIFRVQEDRVVPCEAALIELCSRLEPE